MHWFHVLVELAPHGVRDASTLTYVAGHAALEAKRVRAVHEHAQGERPPEFAAAQEPKAIDEDDAMRSPETRLGAAGVGGEIVARKRGFLALLDFAETREEQVPVNGIGMVEVGPDPAGHGQRREIAVEVVQGQDARAPAEETLQSPGEPGFAGAASADDGDDQGLPMCVTSHERPTSNSQLSHGPVKGRALSVGR